MKKEDTVAVCSLCNSPCVHFARSHIIPWGFMKKSHYANDMSLSAKGEHPRFLPKGLYDEHIVCDKCEHEILSPLDQYAIRIYRDQEKGERMLIHVSTRQCISCVIMPNVDRRKLRGFFASLLWRCSMSQYVAFDSIDIGKTYCSRIAKDLLSEGEFNYIDAFGYTYLPNEEDCIANGLLDGFVLPRKIRLSFEGRSANGYIIELPYLHFKVSIDQREHPLRIMDDTVALTNDRLKDVSFSLSSPNDNKCLALFQFPQTHERIDFFTRVCKQVVGSYRKRGIKIKKE